MFYQLRASYVRPIFNKAPTVYGFHGCDLVFLVPVAITYSPSADKIGGVAA
jgi:hypothetical protein